jgi:hypothetical protein
VIAIVGCGARKLAGVHPARELYTGPLFVAARDDVERRGLRWLVLSARYGLIEPDRELESYDRTIAQTKRELAEGCGPHHRACSRGWCYVRGFVAGVDVLLRCAGELPLVAEVHAGAAYVDVLLATLAVRDGHVRLVEPCRGLELGARLAWYAARRRAPVGEQLELFGRAA